MIKNFLILNIALSMFLWGKPPGALFFCNVDKPLDKVNPAKEANIRQKAGLPFYYYIYSKKKFDDDMLYMLFIHFDNKAVWLPKEEITQTLEVPVSPDDTAVKGQVVIYKGGQYFVRVFTKKEPEKPVCETELWVE